MYRRRHKSTKIQRHESLNVVLFRAFNLSCFRDQFFYLQTCLVPACPDTFLNHLFRYLQEGNGFIKSDELMALSTVSSEQKNHILDKFEDLGTEFLKPVFDALGGEIDYEELKIIRLYFHQGP